MLGVDVVDVRRFRSLLERSPNLASRFFTDAERAYCEGSADPELHLAATFAAKEAVMKALRLVPAAATAPRIEIIRASSGCPVARVDGIEVPVSISHDGGVAVAVAIVSAMPLHIPKPASTPAGEARPNEQLVRYLANGGLKSGHSTMQNSFPSGSAMTAQELVRG